MPTAYVGVGRCRGACAAVGNSHVGCGRTDLGLAQPVKSWACSWATVGYLAPIYIFSDIYGYPRVNYSIRTRSDISLGRVWVRPVGKILYPKPNSTGRISADIRTHG
jgi:hypothetical protein